MISLFTEAHVPNVNSAKEVLLDARKFAKKEKILPFAKPASQIVRDVSRDGPFKIK